MPHDQYTVPHYFTVQSEGLPVFEYLDAEILKKGKKPVMVWFHGGGMMTGSGVGIMPMTGRSFPVPGT